MISFAVLHMGDHGLNGGVRKFMGEEAFSTMQEEIKAAFNRGDVPDVIRLMDKHFGMNNYSLWHLFKDEQRKVLDQVLHSTLEGIETSFRKIVEKNYAIMGFLQSLQMPLPKPLAVAAEYVFNLDLQRNFKEEDIHVERLDQLIHEAERWHLEIDKETIGFVAKDWINAFMEKVQQHPEELSSYEKMGNVLGVLTSLSVEPDLWKAQNAYFSITKKLYRTMRERAEKEEDLAKRWVELFHRLGDRLHVKVT